MIAYSCLRGQFAIATRRGPEFIAASFGSVANNSAAIGNIPGLFSNSLPD